jgi:hypothetical protein
MIKPEQIPQVAVNAAIAKYAFESGRGWNMFEVIAAALNAWPGALREEGVFTMDDDCMILPLPQEKKND